MRQPKFLEWLWIAQATIALAGFVGLAFTNGILLLVMLECLGYPLGMVLKNSSTYSMLPTFLQYFLGYATVVMNGGIFYILLRICFRKRSRETEREFTAGSSS